MRIHSAAFAPDGAIPPQYTCDGRDVSPPLAWSGVPLDVALPDLRRPTRARLEAAMQGHVIAQTALVGTYQKRR